MNEILSIVIPTKNIISSGLADDFKLFLQLLRLQTYKNTECLVIDGASTDGTVELLNRCQAAGRLSFISEPDEGKFFAYNKGIAKAKGKYIMLLSCDDFIHDITALFDVVDVMEKENADFLASPSYCRHPQGFTFLFVPSLYNVFQVMPCPRQAMVFKKEVLQKEGMFDTNIKYMADFDLIIRLIMNKYKRVLLNKNYITYRAGQKLIENPQQEYEDAKQVFVKNYSQIYPLNTEILEKMLSTSEFPKQLLDVLATYFPIDEKDKFLETCEQLRQIRIKAMKNTQES